VKTMKIISRILTLNLIFWAIFILPLGYLFVAAGKLFAPSGKYAHAMARRYLAMIAILAGARIHVEGRENLDPRQSYLIIANHKSAMDIPVLARVLHIHYKFFAAHFLFRYPFFGWSMAMAGYLPIDRTNREAAYASIHKGSRLLEKEEASLLIFPEGTRSPRIEVQPFKKGFLHIAQATHRPILPVVLYGTEKLKYKKSFWFHPGKIHVKILSPIPTAQLEETGWEALRTRVESTFRSAYMDTHQKQISAVRGQ